MTDRGPAPSARSIAAKKQRVRRDVAARIRAAPPDRRREWDLAIQRRILAHPVFVSARRIHCYLALPVEAATEPVVRAALAQGKEVAVPVVEAEPSCLRFAAITDYDRDLAPGYRGILEPRFERRRFIGADQIDLFLIPGVAFDAGGYRLGRGLGYYDRCLAGLAPRQMVCALAYELQVLDRLPVEAHDVQVDLIMTEKRIISCPRK
ncbi:MAG: 5-formyltetrahydrofolate cyclo-ligase [Nitrospirota bacterium]